MSIIAKGRQDSCGYKKPEKDGRDRTILTMARELDKKLSKPKNDLVSQVTQGNQYNEEISRETILKNLVVALDRVNGSNIITPSGKVDITTRTQKLKDTREQLAETAKKYGFTIRKVGSGIDSRLTITHNKETLYDTGPRGMKRITPDYTALFGSPLPLPREDRPY